MKAFLQSSIEFPQDALLVANNYIHDRLKQKEKFGFHVTTRKYRVSASFSILARTKRSSSSKLIFAQPVKKSFFITKPKGSLPSSQKLGRLCCLYCRKIFETLFNIILPSHPVTPSSLLLFRSSDYSFVCRNDRTYMCYIPSSSHTALFLHYSLLMCDKYIWANCEVTNYVIFLLLLFLADTSTLIKEIKI